MKKRHLKIILLYLLSTLLFLISMNSSHKTPDPIDDKQEKVTVYLTESMTVTRVPLETYVARVVASEMPSSFHIEALKAQAVAARTYAVAKLLSNQNPDAHPHAPLCDSTHCQVYSPNTEIPDKIKNAVQETESELLYYDGELVTNALYHAASGGQTVNSEDVFVSAVPYLKSVNSPYENTSARSGHGVGMSQQGANGMAKAGYDYKKILSHYYSGTVVR